MAEAIERKRKELRIQMNECKIQCTQKRHLIEFTREKEKRRVFDFPNLLHTFKARARAREHLNLHTVKTQLQVKL